MSKNKRVLSVIIGIFAIIFGWGSYETLGNINKDEGSPTNQIASDPVYQFSNEEKWLLHYQKHKDEFGSISQQEYLEQANRLILSENKNVIRKQQSDGDTAIYHHETNEFVVLSANGIIRTYFKPEGGMDYFDRQ